MVLDASVVLEILLRTAVGKQLEERLLGQRQLLRAPYLLDVEVAQVLRRYSLKGSLDDYQGRRALDAFAAFPLKRYPHGLMLPRIWALRGNLSAYDAAYVALAEMLDAPLLTRDRRLATAPGHVARIEAV